MAWRDDVAAGAWAPWHGDWLSLALDARDHTQGKSKRKKGKKEQSLA